MSEAMQPAPELPAIEYAERSDPGRDPSKQVNEDACGHRETRFGHLCVVCDGMGGHAAGREAAELALATIFETFAQAPDGAAPAEVLKSAIEEASRRVHAMPAAEAGMGRPGSTVVAFVMHARGTEVGHVGDSRGYLVHEGRIFRVTRDHSVVQELVNRGILTQAQAAQHPDANQITRALGMAPDVEADVRPQAVHHVTGDTFLLCSDGLSDLVEDHEILDVVGNVPPAQAVAKLVDIANARGGHDNITVVVLRARTSALGPQAGIAPTIAQTSIDASPAPHAAHVTVSDTARTIVETEKDRPTEVPLPAGPLEPTIPPGPSPAARSPGARVAKAPPLLIVAIVLATVAIILFAAILVVHFGESGERARAGAGAAPTTAAAPDAAAVDGGAGLAAPPSAAPTALAPVTVEVPASASPVAEPIAPLEPPTPAPTKAHRKPRP